MESVCSGNITVGSNPTFSAIFGIASFSLRLHSVACAPFARNAPIPKMARLSSWGLGNRHLYLCCGMATYKMSNELRNSANLAEFAMAFQDAYSREFPFKIQRSGPFNSLVIQLKGPSGSGKSTMAQAIKNCFEAVATRVSIVERDACMEAEITKRNHSLKHKVTLESLNNREKQRMTSLRNAVNHAVDDKMLSQVQSALAQNHVVIWDTTKSLPKSLFSENTLFVGIEVCCLDDPETRDYEALAKRKTGVMELSKNKQKELSGLVLSPEKGSLQTDIDLFYGWTQDGKPVVPG